MPKFKIGVFGSSAGEEIEQALEKTTKLGGELGKRQCIVITGACSGLPYVAAAAARKNGAEVWGYSPCSNLEGQKQFTPNDDLSIYAKIQYVPESFEFTKDDLVSKKYRNVLSTASCDAGIIISGRWGTLHEFCSLYDYGKVIGVLTGTGGVADELPSLMKKISKVSKAKVIFNDSPKELARLIINELEKL